MKVCPGTIVVNGMLTSVHRDESLTEEIGMAIIASCDLIIVLACPTAMRFSSDVVAHVLSRQSSGWMILNDRVDTFIDVHVCEPGDTIDTHGRPDR